MSRQRQFAAVPIATSTDQYSSAHYLVDNYVSEYSRFSDNTWRFEHDTPGQDSDASTIRWDFKLDCGDFFSHDKYTSLRFELKVFMASMFNAPQNARPLSGGSAYRMGRTTRYLVNWMIRNEYSQLCDLTEAASREYLDDLVDFYLSKYDLDPQEIEQEFAEDEQVLGITEGAIRPYLQIWTHLWRQADALREAGINPLPVEPFGGKSAKSLANELATKAASWIPPVPDEVALPIMAAAVQMIGVPAEDVIRLHLLYIEGLRRIESCSNVHQARVLRKLITGFRFSSRPGERAPWREPMCDRRALSLFNGKWITSQHDVHLGLRKLIEHTMAACSLIIQSQVGTRINEVCGLQNGIDAVTSLPSCVEKRTSKSGLHDLYFLKGKLSKLRFPGTEAEWLMGSRPRGSVDVPHTVRAIDVMERLLSPLRDRAQDPSLRKHLFLSFTAPSGYPRNGESIGPISTATLLHHQREFIGNFVDLSTIPERSSDGSSLSTFIRTRGACIWSHSWRKTFALYVFRVDSRMIPAIAQQFQHLSLAMTEQGYIGNDPTLIETMDGVRTRQTAMFFYELARGTRPAAGRLTKLIEEHLQELQDVIAGLDERKGKEAMECWVISQDLRIWYTNHGKCFFPLQPLKARCHEVAATRHWTNKAPNYGFRSPDVCLGCPLFAVDREHSEFWLRRYFENQRAWSAAKKAGLELDYRINMDRALQSAAVLRALGIGLPKPMNGEPCNA